jgi:transposase
MKSYPPAFTERAGKLAVESDQPIAQTARDLGGNANTRHPWIGTSPRGERQDTQVQGAHLYEELHRLRKEHARFKEERTIGTKAAADCAQQLPCRPPGCRSSTPRAA